MMLRRRRMTDGAEYTWPLMAVEGGEGRGGLASDAARREPAWREIRKEVVVRVGDDVSQ